MNPIQTKKGRKHIQLLALLICLLFIAYSCQHSDGESTTDSETVSEEGAFSLVSSSPEEGETVSNQTTFTFTFSQAIDTTSVSLNTSSTDCSGEIQIYSSGLCLQFTSSTPTYSNGNKTLTLTTQFSACNNDNSIKLTTSIKTDDGQSFSSDQIINFDSTDAC